VSDEGEHGSGGGRALIARRVVASAASLAAAAVLAHALLPLDSHNGGGLALAVLIATPAVAAAAVWSRRLGLQLLARGLWWSLLLFGGLVAITDGGAQFGAVLAAGSGVALLVAGSSGLDGGGARFQPVAFRGTLMLALVLAIADTTSFIWLGTAQAFVGKEVRLILLVPPMIAGVVGLLSLRTWGLLLSLGCNILVVVLAGTGLLDLPRELQALFIGTAALQLLVPIPMWVTIIRRRPPPPDRWRSAKRIVSTVVIVGIVALSAYFALFHTRQPPDFL
jgi:hypothetical protein